MSRVSIEDVASVLEARSPAVLTTYRKDGSANVSPVWRRGSRDARARRGDVTEIRADIAGRYLGAQAGEPRVWDLSAILPS